VVGIWISYRKSDDPFAAVALDERLCQSFGRERVFRDSRSIPLGVDFEPELWGTLARSAVLVVMIGRRWLDIASDGNRYVDSPDDFVRREIAFAARIGVRIVPVLVGDVTLPVAEELPADIQLLATRQYLRLHVRNFEYDIRRLVEEFSDMLGVPTAVAVRPSRSNGRQAGDFRHIRGIRVDHGIARQNTFHGTEDLSR
jgi:hypothetical protein